jgi:hypothetical protein
MQNYGFVDADILRDYLTQIGSIKKGQFGPFGAVKASY